MDPKIDLDAVMWGSRRWVAARVLIAVVVAAIGGFVGNVACRYFMETVWDQTVESGNWYRRAVFFAIALFVASHFVVKPRWLYEQLFRFRWVLAGLLFAACVVLQLHGSSLGVWAHWVQPTAPPIADSTPIFGTLRPERTDEFMVNTPLAFSQWFNGYAPVNSIAEAWPTNMLTVYNQPVLDPTLIAKPFYWGYVLLGTARGLAWFWCGRLIALFMVSFEMFRVLANDKRVLSLSAAFLMAFAPVVQWWFSVNFLVEMLVFGQLAVLSAWFFLRMRRAWIKIVWAVVFALSVCAYIFSLYPAWMVPLAYLFAVLFVWAVVASFRAAQRSWAEWLYVLLALAMVGGLVAYWYLGNRDVIAVIRNTVYPGQRQETGGGSFGNLFNYGLNLVMPYFKTGSWAGGAVFPGFFPLGEIIAVALLVTTRLKDKLLLALLCVNAFLILFAAVGFPMWLAKASLLSYSHAWGVAIVSTGVSVFILMRSLAGFVILRDAGPRHPVSLSRQPASLSRHPAALFRHPAAGRTSSFIKANGLTRVVPAVLICYALIAGLSVNPLMRGVSAVTGKPVYTEIEQLQSEDPGIWIATWPLGNYTIMAGAPTINSANIIPALGRWEILDPDHKYMDVYNRYAHIVIGFNTTQTTFGAPGEIIGIELAMTDLQKLNVKYILLNEAGETELALPALSWAGGHATEVYNEYQIIIYKIEYDS